jgi:phosphatidylinositol glycan class Z
MWRRTYLFLLLVRIFFAFSPSYLHPDENFQGPEVFAGRIYPYPSHATWEFTSAHPIRSVFPLWLVYSLPMRLIRWYYNETGKGSPPPELVYYALRGGMLMLSFVLEDWAIYELVSSPLSSPRNRRKAVVLVASSYVTWTYQTHTFSNSLETLLVAWGLVLIQRIVDSRNHSAYFSCIVLSLVAVLGVFNRITFPAFLLLPGLQLLPHFIQKPLSVLCIILFGFFFALTAVLTDTAFYRPSISIWKALRSPMIITPLNNLLYNSNPANLATHGLHPRYQHFLANLPQLLGPAYLVIIWSLWLEPLRRLKNRRAISAISGAMILSIFPHQEPRFLIPCVPLLLTCVRRSRPFFVAWIIFNAALGFLMGVYHQGGIIPTQLNIPAIVSTSISKQADGPAASRMEEATATVFWWKTYSPPLWLLGDNSSSAVEIITRDLMGIPGAEMARELEITLPGCQAHHPTMVGADSSSNRSFVFLVAPRSAMFLDRFTRPSLSQAPSSPVSVDFELQTLWTYTKHLNLDDLDFDEDGIFATLRRVIGRRGLNVWSVKRLGCN